MNWFWSGFWPNLASTFVGVIVGVPIALWLNSLSGRAAGRARKAEEHARLRTGLLAVLAALAHNRGRLGALLDVLQKHEALFDVTLDTAAWEASRDEIVPFLRSADLHRRVAFHFDRLRSLARLCSLYLDMIAGVASALGGVEKTRGALRDHLIATSRELLAQTDSIHAEISALLRG